MTPRQLEAALHELSPLRSYLEPIVSLYLDTRWSDEQQRERVRLFVRERGRAERARHAESPAAAAIGRTLDRVEAHASSLCEQRVDEARGGVAVFGCEALNLWRVLVFKRPMRNELSLDAMPHLLQLARLADDVEPTIVACAHWRGAQIFQIAYGEVVGEISAMGALPRRHGEGGEATHGGLLGATRGAPQGGVGARYERERHTQRHLEELSMRQRRLAAEELTRLFDAMPRSKVILAGTSELVGGFERELPERVRAAVVGRLPHPPERGAVRDGIVATAMDAVIEAERRKEREVVDAAIGQALRGGGRAVLGPEDVVMAANERRVHRLVIEEDFQRPGWRCQNCNAIGTTHHDSCPYCQGPLTTVSKLDEELVARVLADDGEVEVVPHTPKLHSYDGVAAMLRQARATGASPPAPVP